MKIYSVRSSYADSYGVLHSVYITPYLDPNKAQSAIDGYRLEYDDLTTAMDIVSFDVPFIPKKAVSIMIGITVNGVERFESVGMYSCKAYAENSDIWKQVLEAVKNNPESYKRIDLSDRGYDFSINCTENAVPSTINFDGKEAKLYVAKLIRRKVVR